MRRFIDSIERVALRARRNILLAAAGIISLGIIAYASVPGPDGVVQACYKRSNGALRVIDPAVTACDNSEAPIQWNQAGVPGITGPQGPAGPQGPQGPAGPGGAAAMVYINLDGSIGHCYNGITGATTGNCGFTVSHPQTGIYNIDFGFDMRTRFYTLTAEEVIFEDDGTFAANPLRPTDYAPSVMQYQVTASGNGLYDRPVMIIVY